MMGICRLSQMPASAASGIYMSYPDKGARLYLIQVREVIPTFRVRLRCGSCYSDEELQRVLSGPGSGTAGASGSNPTLSYLSTCGDEEWDCRFTFDVHCKPPPNNPDGDPVVINDYHVKRHLGAGESECR